MPELNPRDRLQPFLLDRLTDDTPGATKESRDRNVMSPQQLKVALLRDFSSLLTHSLDAQATLTRFLTLLRETLSINRAAIFLQSALMPLPASVLH